MTFEKSIIIPFDLYQQCRLDKTDRTLDILLDDTLPSDTKLKLYNQAALTKKSDTATTTVPTTTSLPFGDHILHNIPDKDKPNVRAILEIFKTNPSELGWTDNLELTLDSETVSGSNLINVLLYFTKNLPVTKDNDIPLGAKELYDKLVSLNMPVSWVKLKPVRPKKRVQRQKPTYTPSDETPLTQKPKRKRRKLVPRSNSDALITWST